MPSSAPETTPKNPFVFAPGGGGTMRTVGISRLRAWVDGQSKNNTQNNAQKKVNTRDDPHNCLHCSRLPLGALGPYRRRPANWGQYLHVERRRERGNARGAPPHITTYIWKIIGSRCA